MIKSSLAVKVIPILSLALYLTVPYKLVQIICFAVLLTELLCFLYALILSKKIQIERNLSTMRLHSGEQAEITFSIINYSRLPVFV